MRHRWVIVLLPLLLAPPLAAQEAGVRDAWATFRLGPPDAPLFRLGHKTLGPIFPIGLTRLDRHSTHRHAPGPEPRAAAEAQRWRQGEPILSFLAPGLATPPEWRWAPPGARTALWSRAVLARADTVRRETARALAAPLLAADDGGEATKSSGDNVFGALLPDAIADFADLGMRVFGRGELGGDWTRYRPCDPALRLNCNPTLFPLLKPEIQFGVQVQGTVSDRLHIDVDYDQRREFDASNNINVYYQGLEGEVLQRVEVGDVAFELPASRFLTEGIPGGNFGFKAVGRMGALDVQAIWAQQKGDVATREFRLTGGGGPEGLVQESRIVLDDADYVRGQFFFLVDPTELDGYPHVNVLGLRATDAPPTSRPMAGGSGIQVYRDERPSLTNPEQQAQLGYFLAEAVSGDGSLRHSGRFRRLVPGEDYLVHPSGLWFMLRSPLRSDEAIAVAYVTEAGTPVGTPDAERAPAGTTPTLLLVRGPSTIHQPGQPTWPYELHQVYRLDASSGVEPGSVELTISLGEPSAGVTYREALGHSLSFLKLFGLDEDSPFERLDEAQIFQPGRELMGGGGIGGGRFAGSYIVFPTLQPFAEPPPLPSVPLSAAEVLAVLGADANRTIYEEPDPVLREGGARFRLSLAYRVRVEGLASSFNLGAFGIREGSEKVTVDGRTLRRGMDYTIDYQLGIVTLNNPQAIFGANPNAEIRATWEQKAAFQIAPTSLYGLSARYDLGTTGEINLLGLYQAEKAIINRPQLGLEPGSIFLGGASGDLRFGAGWLDRLLGFLPGLDDSPASSVRLSGELGVSLPDPNRRGDTFLDDFEATEEVPLGLDRDLWRLGSVPGDPAGATDVLPFPLDASTATRLVWQHDLLDGAGQVYGPLLPRQIDQQIAVAGTERTEPVLYLSFGQSSDPPGERRWRSMTTVLETTGRDMTRSEYLEFYAAAEGGDLALVFDIGTVSEDAFYVDAQGQTNGVYPDGRPWGLGILDEEARTAQREIWSAALDSLGLWNQACRAEPGQQAYPLGDVRANCARGNGRVDTEDLDGNGILDAADGAYFRYVVRLGPSSPYLVRDRSGTGTQFRLYRIPLRGPNAIPVGGATEGTWRYIKHLRLTVAGVPAMAHGDITLARMRVVGSRWAKRDVEGIRSGLIGDEPGIGAGTTEFRVGPVSRITDGDAYTPPPGVGDELLDPNTAFAGSTVEFNEKSLRLSYGALQPGDRAEVYYRYPQQPRNFLNYREMRLWAVPRRGGWGASDGERLVVSVGTDARNRYLFVTPLHAPPPSGRVRQENWLPEIVIDFRRWFELKAEAERWLIENGAVPGEPVVVWSADSTYAVVLEDRARAPNLAAVREIGFAVYNPGGVPVDGEVWLDELRLGAGMTDPGLAGQIALDVRAGDIASASIAYSDRGALFRRMNETPDYQAATDLSVGGTLELGRLAPKGWGLVAPITISHSRSGIDPTFLAQSDVRADQLPGLRETGTSRTSVALTLRRETRSENPFMSVLVDGVSLRLGYRTARSTALTTEERSEGLEAGIAYSRSPAVRDFDVTPGLLEALLRGLVPRVIEESGLFQRLLAARLRWSPETISFGGTYSSDEAHSYRYASILASSADAAVRPITVSREALESNARITFRPFSSLSLGASTNTSRDLLPTARSGRGADERAAIAAARSRLAGIDLGWERMRLLTTFLDFRPNVASWLRPSLGYTARYRMDRSPSFLERRVVGEDTAAVLQRDFDGDRQLTRSLVIDPPALVRAVSGGDARDGTGGGGGAGGVEGALGRVIGAVETIDLTWTDGLGSSFEWEAVDPSLGYQFGLGRFDRFRIIDGDTAALVNARGSFRARTMVRLPLGTRVDVAYGESESEIHELRGGRRTASETSWPDVRFEWTALPVPSWLRPIIDHGSVSAGYRHSARSSIFGAAAGQEWAGKETVVPLQLSLGFGNGLSGSYTGQLGTGDSRDPTGRTEESGAQHAIQLGGTFAAPPFLRESFPAPIHVSLRYGQQEQVQCRLGTGAGAECIPFVDYTHKEFGLTLDTVLSQLTVGFQMSYIDRQSYVGTRTGSSQFQLGLFGEFNFAAGTFAAGGFR